MGRRYHINALRILTILQPWASLSVVPAKNGKPVRRYDTRREAPRHPLPIDIAIHASDRNDRWVLDEIHRQHGYLRSVGIHYPRRELSLGCIIGLARITAVHPTDKLDARFRAFAGIDESLYDWSPGRWAYRLEDVIQLPDPVHVPGVRRDEALTTIEQATADAVFASLSGLP